MKQILFVVSLSGLALLGAGEPLGAHSAQAFRLHPVGTQFAQRSAVASLPLRVGQLALSPRTRPHQAAPGSVQSDAQLGLPRTAFPTTSLVEDDHAESAARADGSLFGNLHGTSYATLGMRGGWLQYFTTHIPDGLFDVVYLGSYYSSPQAATAALNDVASNPVFSQGARCDVGDQCYLDGIGVSFPDGEYQGLLLIVQRSNALAEIISVVPAADVDALHSTIEINVKRVADAFLNVLLAPPSATTTPSSTATPPASPRPSVMPTGTATPLPPSTPMPTATPTTIPTASPTSLPPTLSVRVTGVPHAGSAGTLRVSVYRSADKTASGADVTVDGRDAGISRVRHSSTNANGVAAFRNLLPRRVGRITIRASKSGYATRTIGVRVKR